jgi:CPA2 family monovalent cation:H+ antiporter-2
MTWAFVENERAHDAELFEAWKEIEEGINFSPRYGELFMKLEEALSTSMQGDWEAPKPGDVPVWTPPGED